MFCHYYIFFKEGSTFSQLAMPHMCYGKSNAILNKCKHPESWEVTEQMLIQLHPIMLAQ